MTEGGLDWRIGIHQGAFVQRFEHAELSDPW